MKVQQVSRATLLFAIFFGCLTTFTTATYSQDVDETEEFSQVNGAPNFVPMVPQQASNWCWAAAVQNVLAFKGISASQAEIAAVAFGGIPHNMAASTGKVVRVLRYYGLKFLVAGTKRKDRKEVLDLVRKGHKVIANTRPRANVGPNATNPFASGMNMGINLMDITHAIVIQGIGPQNEWIISDPFSGKTTAESYAGLNNRWRWKESIVVE